MEKKLRIQLFDEEGRMVGDRTVAQDPELSKGPLQDHFGLFRIEFTLDSKDDVEKAKIYLDQMVGSLPLRVDKPKKQDKTDSPGTRETMVEILTNLDEDWHQDRLINYLRDEGFVFRTTEFLGLIEAFDQIEIKDRHKEYQWMVKETRTAKSVKADKYDPFLMVGIQLILERTDKVPIYFNGEFMKILKVPIPEKPKEVIKTTKMLIFPKFMEEDEKEKFMMELRALEVNPEKAKGKFFIRWAKHVKNLPELSQDKPQP